MDYNGNVKKSSEEKKWSGIIRKKCFSNPVLQIPWRPYGCDRNLDKIEEFPWNLETKGVAKDLTITKKRNPLPISFLFNRSKKSRLQMNVEEMINEYPTLSRTRISAALLLCNHNVEDAKIMLKLQIGLEGQSKTAICNGQEEIFEPVDLSIKVNSLDTTQVERKNRGSPLNIISNTLTLPSKKFQSIESSTDTPKSTNNIKENAVLDLSDVKTGSICLELPAKGLSNAQKNLSRNIFAATHVNNADMLQTVITCNARTLGEKALATSPEICANDANAENSITTNKLRNYRKDSKTVANQLNKNDDDTIDLTVSSPNILNLHDNVEIADATWDNLNTSENITNTHTSRTTQKLSIVPRKGSTKTAVARKSFKASTRIQKKQKEARVTKSNNVFYRLPIQFQMVEPYEISGVSNINNGANLGQIAMNVKNSDDQFVSEDNFGTDTSEMQAIDNEIPGDTINTNLNNTHLIAPENCQNKRIQNDTELENTGVGNTSSIIANDIVRSEGTRTSRYYDNIIAISQHILANNELTNIEKVTDLQKLCQNEPLCIIPSHDQNCTKEPTFYEIEDNLILVIHEPCDSNLSPNVPMDPSQVNPIVAASNKPITQSLPENVGPCSDPSEIMQIYRPVDDMSGDMQHMQETPGISVNPDQHLLPSPCQDSFNLVSGNLPPTESHATSSLQNMAALPSTHLMPNPNEPTTAKLPYFNSLEKLGSKNSVFKPSSPSKNLPCVPPFSVNFANTSVTNYLSSLDQPMDALLNSSYIPMNYCSKENFSFNHEYNKTHLPHQKVDYPTNNSHHIVSNPIQKNCNYEQFRGAQVQYFPSSQMKPNAKKPTSERSHVIVYAKPQSNNIEETPNSAKAAANITSMTQVSNFSGDVVMHSTTDKPSVSSYYKRNLPDQVPNYLPPTRRLSKSRSNCNEAKMPVCIPNNLAPTRSSLNATHSFKEADLPVYFPNDLPPTMPLLNSTDSSKEKNLPLYSPNNLPPTRPLLNSRHSFKETNLPLHSSNNLLPTRHLVNSTASSKETDLPADSRNYLPPTRYLLNSTDSSKERNLPLYSSNNLPPTRPSLNSRHSFNETNLPLYSSNNLLPTKPLVNSRDTSKETDSAVYNPNNLPPTRPLVNARDSSKERNLPLYSPNNLPPTRPLVNARNSFKSGNLPHYSANNLPSTRPLLNSTDSSKKRNLRLFRPNKLPPTRPLLNSTNSSKETDLPIYSPNNSPATRPLVNSTDSTKEENLPLYNPSKLPSTRPLSNSTDNSKDTNLPVYSPNNVPPTRPLVNSTDSSKVTDLPVYGPNNVTSTRHLVNSRDSTKEGSLPLYIPSKLPSTRPLSNATNNSKDTNLPVYSPDNVTSTRPLVNSRDSTKEGSLPLYSPSKLPSTRPLSNSTNNSKDTNLPVHSLNNVSPTRPLVNSTDSSKETCLPVYSPNNVSPTRPLVNSTDSSKETCLPVYSPNNVTSTRPLVNSRDSTTEGSLPLYSPSKLPSTRSLSNGTNNSKDTNLPVYSSNNVPPTRPLVNSTDSSKETDLPVYSPNNVTSTRPLVNSRDSTKEGSLPLYSPFKLPSTRPLSNATNNSKDTNLPVYSPNNVPPTRPLVNATDSSKEADLPVYSPKNVTSTRPLVNSRDSTKEENLPLYSSYKLPLTRPLSNSTNNSKDTNLPVYSPNNVPPTRPLVNSTDSSKGTNLPVYSPNNVPLTRPLLNSTDSGKAANLPIYIPTKLSTTRPLLKTTGSFKQANVSIHIPNNSSKQVNMKKNTSLLLPIDNNKEAAPISTNNSVPLSSDGCNINRHVTDITKNVQSSNLLPGGSCNFPDSVKSPHIVSNSNLNLNNQNSAVSKAMNSSPPELTQHLNWPKNGNCTTKPAYTSSDDNHLSNVSSREYPDRLTNHHSAISLETTLLQGDNKSSDNDRSKVNERKAFTNELRKLMSMLNIAIVTYIDYVRHKFVPSLPLDSVNSRTPKLYNSTNIVRVPNTNSTDISQQTCGYENIFDVPQKKCIVNSVKSIRNINSDAVHQEQSSQQNTLNHPLNADASGRCGSNTSSILVSMNLQKYLSNVSNFSEAVPTDPLSFKNIRACESNKRKRLDVQSTDPSKVGPTSKRIKLLISKENDKYVVKYV